MGNPGKRATRRRQTKQKQNTQCVGHHYSQTNKNNINKKMRPPTEVKTNRTSFYAEIVTDITTWNSERKYT
jgi:transposase